MEAHVLPRSPSSRAQERLAELRREFEKEGFPLASGVHGRWCMRDAGACWEPSENRGCQERATTGRAREVDLL